MARKRRTVTCSETLNEFNVDDCYIVEVDSVIPHKTFISKEYYDKHKPSGYKKLTK